MSQTIEDRFWVKVEKTDTCWNWKAGCSDDGYGRFDKYRSHQFSYILKHGSIPAGKELNHLCNNKICVRPDHLEAITHTEHMRKTPGTWGYKWAQRTHCENGHPFKEGNLAIAAAKKGFRKCLTCTRAKTLEWQQNNREKARAAARRWKANNLEYVRNKDRERHAMKKLASPL